MRMIDADELMTEIMDSDLDHLQRDDWKEVIQIVQDAPTIQPQRMRGRWMESDTDGFVCSVCHNGYKMQPTIMGKPMFEFCPCCGAQMDGQEEQDE